MEKIRVLLQKHRETVSYVFWGAMTTAVNYAVYLLLRQFQVYYAYANVAAWAAGVLFAYFVNKIFVFQSRDWNWRVALRELWQMVAARVFSGLLEQGILMLFVESLQCNDKIVKLFANVVVVIVNYVLSKWIIFKPKKNESN